MNADNGCPNPNTVSENGQRAATSSASSILIVEDNLEVAGALKITCELSGYSAEIAGSSEYALSALATRRFDLILLDLNLSPGQSDGKEGLALLARIKELR
ncbi:MAG: response regulator [Novosphingobium sp.]|nr:response regulator [Novosphingobium sp.]